MLTTHSYGVLNQLTGLFLILSMPGSAVVVAVVRRVTMWHEDGSGHLVRRWAGRVHRQGSLVVLVWGVIVFTSRHWVAVLLGQRSGIGIAAMLTAAAFFVLLSLDRGLLQARQAYRPLAANLLVEGGVRTVAVLALVAAGTGPSGAAIGILAAEVVAATHARWAAVRAWSATAGRPGRSGPRSWVTAVRPDACSTALDRAATGSWWTCSSPRSRLSMVALLQNVDVLVVGRDNPSHSGAYAAVSVTQQGHRLRGHRAGRLPAARGGHPLAPGRPCPAPAGRGAGAAGRAGRRAVGGGAGRAQRLAAGGVPPRVHGGGQRAGPAGAAP